ncbi:MAG: hypothetical protein Q9186_003010 [Xanthomendoza sp. 1 TL-2023]
MAASEWPQCPNLARRPLDTALLLNRDFATQLRNRIELIDNNEDGVPADIFLRLLDNVDTICNKVCERGPQEDALDTFAKVQEAVRSISGRTADAEPARIQPAEVADAMEEWKDDEARFEVKEEPQPVESPSMNAAYPVMHIPAVPSPEHDRETWVDVTIRIGHEPTSCYLRSLGLDALSGSVRNDLRPLDIHIGYPKVMSESGDVKFSTSETNAAILRDRSMYRPGALFGPCAYVTTPKPRW